MASTFPSSAICLLSWSTDTSVFPEVISSKIASWRNTYCGCEEERKGEAGEGRREREKGEKREKRRGWKGEEERVERGKSEK